MQPVEHFKHCPACGTPRTGAAGVPFKCPRCGFVYYFNPTVAAAVILSRSDGRVLFITRARDPAKGLLAFPGGFIDIGECAEDGLRREVREEVGLEVGELEFLCSRQNEYPYHGVNYPVLDLLFAARVMSDADARALDGVSRIDWLPPEEVSPGRLAFASLRAGLAAFLDRRR